MAHSQPPPNLGIYLNAMRFDVLPLWQVGPLAFGMPRVEVRAALNSVFEPFHRASGSPEGDFFAELELFAYYGLAGGLEAVEFAGAVRPTFHGVDLFSLSPVACRATLTASGYSGVQRLEHLIFPEASICFWFPEPDEDEPVTCASVLVGKPGYYGATKVAGTIRSSP